MVTAEDKAKSIVLVGTVGQTALTEYSYPLARLVDEVDGHLQTPPLASPGNAPRDWRQPYPHSIATSTSRCAPIVVCGEILIDCCQIAFCIHKRCEEPNAGHLDGLSEHLAAGSLDSLHGFPNVIYENCDLCLLIRFSSYIETAIGSRPTAKGQDIREGYAPSQKVWGNYPTAITGTFVESLTVPGALVEIEVVAIVDAD